VLGTGEREAARDRDRIVNLSDGVFAIALTLLVLDIRVPNIPENVVGSELPGVLLALWPKYLGYVLSFVVISTFWIIHHTIFRPIRPMTVTYSISTSCSLCSWRSCPSPPRSSASTATINCRWPSTPRP
jgi:uncharacterized membrane protein